MARTTAEVRAVPGADGVSRALDLLWQSVSDDGVAGGDGKGVATSMRVVTKEAHAAGLLPEELLTLLKGSWRGRPFARRNHQSESDDEQLSRIVTMCIKGYFGKEN